MTSHSLKNLLSTFALAFLTLASAQDNSFDPTKATLTLEFTDKVHFSFYVPVLQEPADKLDISAP